MRRPRILPAIVRDALFEYIRHNGPRLGAALAYYVLFALAPLLIVAIGVAGLVFGAEAARGEVVTQIEGLVGRDGARVVEEMLAADGLGRALPTTIIGLLTLLIGATSAFSALQGALNEIWDVPARSGGVVLGFLRGRILSFGMVLVIGFLLCVSLAMSAALAAMGDVFESRLPGGAALWQAVNLLVSFGFTTVLFAMIYKVLPDVDLAWSDVWVGGLITAFLFGVGEFVIGLYLGRSAIASSFGAAGSAIVMLIWIYYSAQVVLFGAEITRSVVRRYGSAARREFALTKPSPAGL